MKISVAYLKSTKPIELERTSKALGSMIEMSMSAQFCPNRRSLRNVSAIAVVPSQEASGLVRMEGTNYQIKIMGITLDTALSFYTHFKSTIVMQKFWPHYYWSRPIGLGLRCGSKKKAGLNYAFGKKETLTNSDLQSTREYDFFSSHFRSDGRWPTSLLLSVGTLTRNWGFGILRRIFFHFA